jgi:flavodoxin/ferredoxin
VADPKEKVMRSLVVYFSQTGNTESIARSIHQGVKRIVRQSDIARIKDVNPRELANYDLIGIGTPWWGRIPANVRRFIENMQSLDGKHVFPFMTHGSLPAGSMQAVFTLLKKKKLAIIGFKDWYGNSLQQFILYPHLTAGHPDNIDQKEARSFGKKMALISQGLIEGTIKHLSRPATIRELDNMYCEAVPYPAELAQADDLLFKHRKLNLNKCTRCGICAENCHTSSIDLSAYPHIFKDTCDMCWFCEQVCPEGAIEMEWGPYAKIHDGFIGFLNDHLIKAEAQNRFRRLMPFDKIGWNTHWYQVSGHPRYVPQPHL